MGDSFRGEKSPHGAAHSFHAPGGGRPPGRSSAQLVVLLTCAFVLLLGAGCTEPSAVGRFASAGESAEQSFSAIASDFPEACIRRERYRLLAGWRADLGTLDEETARSCAGHTKAARRLIGANRVLIRYLDALGKLAAGDLVVYDDSLEDVTKALGDSELIDEAGLDAVSGICGTLANAAAGKWRRSRLSAVIDSTNAQVRILTAALHGIISSDYTQLLDAESEAARKFYLGEIREHGEGEPLTALLVYDKWREEEAVIEAKRTAAAAYVKVLDKIATGHQTLYERRNELGSKEVRKLVLEHVNAIEDLLADVRAVF
jgi:hypothetical protein